MAIYADHLKIYQHRTCVAQYPLPPDGVKNGRFSPEGRPTPRHLPKHRKHGSEQEEKRLRAMGPIVAAYVDYVIVEVGYAEVKPAQAGLFFTPIQKAAQDPDDPPHLESGLQRVGIGPQEQSPALRLDRPAHGTEPRDQLAPSS